MIRQLQTDYGEDITTAEGAARWELKAAAKRPLTRMGYIHAVLRAAGGTMARDDAFATALCVVPGSSGIDPRLVAAGFCKVPPRRMAELLSTWVAWWRNTQPRPTPVGSSHNCSPEAGLRLFLAGVQPSQFSAKSTALVLGHDLSRRQRRADKVLSKDKCSLVSKLSSLVAVDYRRLSKLSRAFRQYMAGLYESDCGFRAHVLDYRGSEAASRIRWEAVRAAERRFQALPKELLKEARISASRWGLWPTWTPEQREVVRELARLSRLGLEERVAAVSRGGRAIDGQFRGGMTLSIITPRLTLRVLAAVLHGWQGTEGGYSAGYAEDRYDFVPGGGFEWVWGDVPKIPCSHVVCPLCAGRGDVMRPDMFGVKWRTCSVCLATGTACSQCYKSGPDRLHPTERRGLALGAELELDSV